MADPTMKLICDRAGYGLARGAWIRTLQAIRALPVLNDRKGG